MRRQTHPSISASELLLLVLTSKSLVVSGHHVALFSHRDALLIVFKEVREQEI
jgi:hypothetical protein